MSGRHTPFSFGGALAARLPRLERRWHGVVFVVLALLAADTLFLLGHRALRNMPGLGDWARVGSVFYQGAVLLHSAIGLALAALVVVFVAVHVPWALRRANRLWLLALTGAVTLGGYAFLTWSGYFFLVHAKSEGNRWLYWGHMAVAAGFLVAYAVHRLFAAGRLPRPQLAGLFAPAALVAAALLAADTTGVIETLSAPPPPRAPLQSVADAAGFAPASGMNASSPFFPSVISLASGARRTNTNSILGPIDASLAVDVRDEVEQRGFAKTRLIGAESCQRCHADIVAQWSQSAHRFSSFNNPFYVASVEPLRRKDEAPNAFIRQHIDTYGFRAVRTGLIKSQWCAGCHDPALLFEGRMRADVDRGDVKAQAGLTCLACHRIKDIPGHTGSANYVWDDQYEDPYIFASSLGGGLAAQIHDLYLKANPEQHKADMLKPVMRESLFCSTCHKVSLEAPLNEYRYVRGQDEWDMWHDSGVALNAARTFYQPPKARECQACHMPLENAVLGDVAAKGGKVLSHRFAAANTGLPFLRGDKDMVARTEAFMRDKLRVAFGGLRVGTTVSLSTEQPDASVEVPAGATAELAVVVRNLGVGHTFPGGTNDSNEGWVEITVADANGRPLVQAGAVSEDGEVTGNTRIYNTVFVDRFSNRITRRNAQDIAALVYTAVIPPGSADLVRFQVPLAALPADAQHLSVTARLLWRKFNRAFSEFARTTEGKSFSAMPADLPITELAKATAELTVVRGDGRSTLALHTTGPDIPAAQRPTVTHDYGIGLLLQGDTVAGRSVLERLVHEHPDCANCLRSLARLYITDRDFAAGRTALEEHERRWPGDPQGAWMWAGLLRGEGDDAAALDALKRVTEVYPGDREAWRLTMEISYRSGKWREAADAAAKILEIDPEDATAHYYAMLSWRSLGDAGRAKYEEAAYHYYQRNESAQQTTLAFRQRDPVSNFEAQPIRVYELR